MEINGTYFTESCLKQKNTRPEVSMTHVLVFSKVLPTLGTPERS